MLIQVINSDNRFDYVKDDILDHLIKLNTITRFKRASGWVTVGVDPMRLSPRRLDQEQARGTKSIVQVEYTDNHYDFITGRLLNSLLDSNKVAKFKRISGWVTVGVDHLRKTKRENTNKNPIELRKLA
jgi:hypothetical protein